MSSNIANKGGSTNGTRSSAMIRRELSRFFLSGVKWTGRPSLGVGAYGSVEPLELNGMMCAGKKIHDVLVDVGNEGADSIAARFVEECKLMSELRHPNVVQFLGLCISPSSPLPILVMEHLYCSLDDLLESTPAIPLYMKRSILRDVALGLAHLHGRNPAIIHRDLTARNVLLNNNMQAKLADFGVARILNLPVGKLEATLSRVPGTSTYMPPEVFNREAKYNSAVDIFSFGHLLLYTLIQKQPGVEAATYVDSSGGIVARTELERREDSVARLYGILGREHPFVEIVTECLQTNAALRPSILTVLSQLEEIKSSVRDPYSRQTRLTLTQMIRKKTAENKRIAAELQRAQEDLLNAKKRIVHLTEKLQRYSQQMPEGRVVSPTDDADVSRQNYYNTADEGFFKGAEGDYESIPRFAASESFSHSRTLSSPSCVSHTTSQVSPPPPVPSSPRPTCLSPDDHPSSGKYAHSISQPGESQPPPFLSLPRMGSRHLSHENLHTAPDYMKVHDVPHRKVLSGTPSRASPLFQGFVSDSESDSDFDDPQFLRKSPQGSAPRSFSPLKMAPSSSSSAIASLYHSQSIPPSSSRQTNSSSTTQYLTHSPGNSPSYQSYTTGPISLTAASSAFLSMGPTSLPSGPTSLSTGPASLSTGPTYLSTGPAHFSTGPASPPSNSSHASSVYDSVPRLFVKSPETIPDISSIQPLTTGMAGKIHFYTDLDPNTLVLLQNTDKGKIPGVRYEVETGQVQIESDSSENTKLASEKFKSAYIYAMTNQVSVMVDVPGDVSESTVENIISAQNPHFGNSTVSYNGMESSLQVHSFSGGELVRLKQALEEAIQKATGTVVKDNSRRSGHITGKTRLVIKKGNLGHEDTDVIVFPNTSNLACKNGVAKAVDEVSQGAVLRQCKTFVTKHGLLGFGETILMKGGGRLKTKYIIQVNPGVGSSINLQDVLRKLVVQALKHAAGKNACSIAFCPLVSTWTDANIAIIAQTMLDSMRAFANERKGRKLRDIRIIVQEQMVFDCFSELAKLS